MAAGPTYRSATDRLHAEAFFAGRPEAAALWGRLADAVAPQAVRVATASRVALLGRTRCIWVHGAHRDGTVTIGFLTPQPLASPRLRSASRGGRWSHHAKVATPDPELVGWLRGAWRADTEPDP